MSEVSGREPLAHLINRMSAQLADTLEASVKKWAPQHKSAGHTREAATTELWASVYAALACSHHWQPLGRQQVLEHVNALTERKPPPQDLTSEDTNAAMIANFTLSEIERLAWLFIFEDNDAALLTTLMKVRGVLLNSDVPFLEPHYVLNIDMHTARAENISAFRNAVTKAFEDQLGPLLLTAADSDVVLCPPPSGRQSVRRICQPGGSRFLTIQFPSPWIVSPGQAHASSCRT